MSEGSRCPDYRLRLFLSVDLAGSTAFKTGQGRELSDGSSQPLWVKVTRDFYREFPKLIQEAFDRLSNGSSERDLSEARHPQVWKTVGDEILFCCRVWSLEHLVSCVNAFLDALRTFGEILDQGGKHLDVKGAGWLAAFPAPNVTATLGDVFLNADQFDEAFEARADEDPKLVDFLGNGIDCGFRIAGKAASDRFVLSVELAWLLAEAAHRDLFGRSFAYHDRQILRGVLRDRPYPIVSIETERNLSRRTVRQYERRMMQHGSPAPLAIRDFLQSFMEDEDIDLPVLKNAGSPVPQDPPPPYAEFRRRWLADAAEIKKRTENEVAAADADATEGVQLPPDLIREVDAAIAKAAQSGSATDQQ